MFNWKGVDVCLTGKWWMCVLMYIVVDGDL